MGNMGKILGKAQNAGLVLGITKEFYPSGGLHYKLSFRRVVILGDKYQLDRIDCDKK
jgi:hypothetical protein